MTLTIAQSNQLRAELVGSSIAHTNDAILLEENESFTATYDLSSETPSVTFNGTLKLLKAYDPPADAIQITPYLQAVGG